MEQYDRDSSYGNDSEWWPHVIRALAEFPQTAVARHLKLKKLRLKDVKDERWKDIWQEVYAAPGRRVLEKGLRHVPDQTLRFNRFSV